MTREHSDKSRQHDTPRTDGAIGMWCKDGVATEYVEPTIVDAGRFIAFARTLERELAFRNRQYDDLFALAQKEASVAPSSTAAATRRCTCYVLPHADDCEIFIGITQSGERVTERRSGMDRRAPSGPSAEDAELTRLLHQRYQDAGDSLARKAAWRIEELTKTPSATASASSLADEIERAVAEVPDDNEAARKLLSYYSRIIDALRVAP